MARPLPCHVWVRDGQSWVPGLLMAWLQRGGRWYGRTVVVTQGQPGVWEVDAVNIRPVGTR